MRAARASNTARHGVAAGDRDCNGPAEEFCRRTHTLELDGDLLDELSPWRDDCASLCTPLSFQSDVLGIPDDDASYLLP